MVNCLRRKIRPVQITEFELSVIGAIEAAVSGNVVIDINARYNNAQKAVFYLLDSFRYHRSILITAGVGRTFHQRFRSVAIRFIRTFVDPNAMEDNTRDFMHFPSSQFELANAWILLKKLTEKFTLLFPQMQDDEFVDSVQGFITCIKDKKPLESRVSIVNAPKLNGAIKFTGTTRKLCTAGQLNVFQFISKVGNGTLVCNERGNRSVFSAVQKFLRRIDPEFPIVYSENLHEDLCVNEIALRDELLSLEEKFKAKEKSRKKQILAVFLIAIAFVNIFYAFRQNLPICQAEKIVDDLKSHFSLQTLYELTDFNMTQNTEEPVQLNLRSPYNYTSFDTICEPDNDYSESATAASVILLFTSLVFLISSSWDKSSLAKKIKKYPRLTLLLVAVCNLTPIIAIGIFFNEAKESLASFGFNKEALPIIKKHLRTPDVWGLIATRVLTIVALILSRLQQ